jgi:hypothetical protein
MDDQIPSLKLRAEDFHDLSIISACFQDAVLPASAMEYVSEDKRFTLVANRFMWEEGPLDHEEGTLYKRIHSGLHFSHVHKVRHKGISFHNPTKIHNLLALKGDENGDVHLIFSDGGHIHLQMEKLLCHCHDIHEPWYTHVKPGHNLENPQAPSSRMHCF